MNQSEYSVGLAETPGYRYADRVDQQLFIAGQVPLDQHGSLVGPGDVEVQARQCLSNLKLLAEHHDFSEDDIRRLTIYVVGDRKNLHAAWASVRDWFGGNVPPATLLGVSLLGYEEQLVEVDATIVSH
jgi:enamine deaminase RidA (YjgF/YER057c/UK114 family)